MKVIANRKGIYAAKDGSTFELKVGENDVEQEQAESLIRRKLVVNPAAKAEEKPEPEQKKEESKPAAKK